MAGTPQRQDSVLPNNPEQVGSAPTGAYDDIADALQAMRAAAGHVSYADIVVRIGRRRRDAGSGSRPGRTTVYDAFRHGRTRVNPSLVAEIVLALTDDEQLADEWEQRCIEARSRVERGAAAPPGPGTNEPEPLTDGHLVGDAHPGTGHGAGDAPTGRGTAASTGVPAAAGGGRAPAADRPAAAVSAAGAAVVAVEAAAAPPASAEPRPVPRRVPLTPGAAVAVCVAALVLNVVGSALATLLVLPVFLDMIGTAFVSILLGPWAGAAVGIATNLVAVAVDGPASIPFALVQVAGALVWGIGVRRYAMGRTLQRLLALNVIAAVVCTLVATPLLATVLDGDVLSNQHPLGPRLESILGAYLPGMLLGNLFYSLLDKIVAGVVAAVSIVSVPRLRAAAPPDLLPTHSASTQAPGPKA